MDKPWLIRTYAGHSSAKKSNELYLKNLSKGQTGISVAFDLPTQTGYDSDHILSKGEVGQGRSSNFTHWGYEVFVQSNPFR
jgi:(2R)-ethylmalonyl-CoA mutase